jgi:hypothetical protein
MRVHPTVTATTMIAQIRWQAQGQMSRSRRMGLPSLPSLENPGFRLDEEREYGVGSSGIETAPGNSRR